MSTVLFFLVTRCSAGSIDLPSFFFFVLSWKTSAVSTTVWMVETQLWKLPVFIKSWKTSAVSTTVWMVETQLCKLRGTSDIYTNHRSRVFYVLSLWRTVSRYISGARYWYTSRLYVHICTCTHTIHTIQADYPLSIHSIYICGKYSAVLCVFFFSFFPTSHLLYSPFFFLSPPYWY